MKVSEKEMLITVIGPKQDQVRRRNKELHDTIDRTVCSKML